MPKLASNSVGGPGVGVKGLGLRIFVAAFAVLPLVPLRAAAHPSQEVPAPGVAAAPNATEPAAVVTMSDDMPMYQPDRVTIRAGDTVEWKNNGMVSHSATDDPSRANKPDNALLPREAKPFNSGSVMPGNTFRSTFSVPGRYRYFCLSHEADKMIGEIEVKPRAQSDAHPVAKTRPPIVATKPPPPQDFHFPTQASRDDSPTPRGAHFPTANDSRPWQRFDRAYSRD